MSSSFDTLDEILKITKPSSLKSASASLHMMQKRGEGVKSQFKERAAWATLTEAAVVTLQLWPLRGWTQVWEQSSPHHLLQPGKPDAYKSSRFNFLKTTALVILPKKSEWKENIAPDVACQALGPDAEGRPFSSEKHGGIPPPHRWKSTCHLGPLIKGTERRFQPCDDAKATSQAPMLGQSGKIPRTQ